MTEVQASVLAVEKQPKPTKKGAAWWKAKLSNGVELPVWDLADATKLSQVPAGALVTFNYETSQNGDYTNYSLKSFVYTGPTTQAAPTEAPKGSGNGGMSPEDKERVTFLSLFSSSAAIHSGLGDVEAAWDAAVDLHKRLFPKKMEAIPAPVATPEPVLEAPVAGAPAIDKPALPWS